jgi:uncharacterized damage-inducible protein DinB
MEKRLIGYLVKEFEGLYNGDNWLDETFHKKLSGLSDEAAFTRPYPEVHSVAEVLSHLIEWRTEILRRLRTATANQLPDERDWIDNETLRDQGWLKLIERFDATQQEIIHFLSEHDDTFIEIPWTEKYSNRYLLAGLIEHDAYHLGQIGLIVAMLRENHPPKKP